LRTSGTVIIGLDAASQYQKFGWAIGDLRSDGVVVKRAGTFGADPEPVLDALASELHKYERALVAIDAPLGWPSQMGTTLAEHSAGDLLFRRKTDQIMRQHFGKSALEVGADRIARASHQALFVLDQLRSRSALDIPLAWRPDYQGAAAIEVYPAATLLAHDLPTCRHKEKEVALASRIALCRRLKPRLKAVRASGAVENEHAFDACLCVLAASDFFEGRCAGPDPGAAAEARKEGWIWAARSRAQKTEEQAPSKALAKST
jgi:predicted RNase H-like nuclease